MPFHNPPLEDASISIYDTDGDTGITTERTADDDTIRFDLGGATPITDAATFNPSSGFWFNTNEDDLDFKVSGDGLEYGIWWDSSTNTGYVNGSTPLVFSGIDLNIKWLVRADPSETDAGIGTVVHSDTASRGGVIFGGRTRGTEGSESVVQDDDVLFVFAALGWSDTDFALAGNIRAEVDGTPSSDYVPRRWTFATTGPSSMPTDAMIIDSNQRVTVGATPGDSTFQVRGSIAGPLRTITGTSTTLDEDDYTALCDDDTAGGAITVNLPDASTCTGRIYHIKKIGSTANVVVDGNGSQTIDRATTATLTSQDESITIQSDGSNWRIL